MPKNKLSDLRNHLFETLEALKDEDKPMDLDRAKAVCNVASQIIDTARVETKFLEVTGETPTDEFFGYKPDNFRQPLPARGPIAALGTGTKRRAI
jgi:hypothetical protein